jgi:site-specific recombinase XerD
VNDQISLNLTPLALPQKRNPALVYLSSLQPKGRQSMASSLEKIAKMCGLTLRTMPWHKLKYEHVQAIVTKLSETLAPATVNKGLAALRGTMKAAWRLELIGAEAYARVHDVHLVKGSRLPTGRQLPDGEIFALFSVTATDKGPSGTRDLAILAVSYAAGLRRAEVASINLEQLKEEEDFITIRLIGKGNKERLVYLNNGARDFLKAYLAVRGSEAGALFYAGRKGGRLIKGQRMTDQAIYGVLKKRAEDANVKDVTPHDLRRTFVSNMLDLGVDLTTVSALAGHANVQTTAKYDRRGEESKKRAARALKLPFQRPG